MANNNKTEHISIQLPLAFVELNKKGELENRLDAYKETLRETRSPQAAIRAYCQGNQWLTENAQAVGNW